MSDKTGNVKLTSMGIVLRIASLVERMKNDSVALTYCYLRIPGSLLTDRPAALWGVASYSSYTSHRRTECPAFFLWLLVKVAVDENIHPQEDSAILIKASFLLPLCACEPCLPLHSRGPCARWAVFDGLLVPKYAMGTRWRGVIWTTPWG